MDPEERRRRVHERLHALFDQLDYEKLVCKRAEWDEREAEMLAAVADPEHPNPKEFQAWWYQRNPRP